MKTEILHYVPLLIGVASVAAAAILASGKEPNAPSAAPTATTGGWDAASFTRPSDAELRRRLTPLQYEVTQEQQAGRHLRRCRLRRAAVQLAGQIRLEDRLAELHASVGAGQSG
jgi:hypothetical protein